MTETYKRANVVIETTTQKRTIAFSSNKLHKSKKQEPHVNNGMGYFSGVYSPEYRDLYITTDEPIKRDDWYLNYINGKFHGVFQAGGSIEQLVDYRTWSEQNVKVVATTNPKCLSVSSVPSVSQSFIEKYIERYNLENPIKDILVSCLIVNVDSTSFKRETIKGQSVILKTNPKDNTVVIKKLQDQFSREEVIEILHTLTRSFIEMGIKPYLEHKYFEHTDKFINEIM